MSPVATTIVTVQPVRGATGVVTTECSAPASTIKVIDWPPTFVEIMCSWGPRIRELCIPYSDSVPARPIRFWRAGSGWYISLLGRRNFFNLLDVPLWWGHSFLQCPVSLQQAHWSWHRGGLLVSPFHEGTVCFTGSEPLNAAPSRAAFCFILLSASCWTSWSQFTKTLFATSRRCVQHSSQQSLLAFGAFVGCLHRIEPQWRC